MIIFAVRRAFFTTRLCIYDGTVPTRPFPSPIYVFELQIKSCARDDIRFVPQSKYFDTGNNVATRMFTFLNWIIEYLYMYYTCTRGNKSANPLANESPPLSDHVGWCHNPWTSSSYGLRRHFHLIFDFVLFVLFIHPPIFTRRSDGRPAARRVLRRRSRIFFYVYYSRKALSLSPPPTINVSRNSVEISPFKIIHFYLFSLRWISEVWSITVPPPTYSRARNKIFDYLDVLKSSIGEVCSQYGGKMHPPPLDRQYTFAMIFHFFFFLHFIIHPSISTRRSDGRPATHWVRRRSSRIFFYVYYNRKITPQHIA